MIKQLIFLTIGRKPAHHNTVYRTQQNLFLCANFRTVNNIRNIMSDFLLWTVSKQGCYVWGCETNMKVVELYLLNMFVQRFPLQQPLL